MEHLLALHAASVLGADWCHDLLREKMGSRARLLRAPPRRAEVPSVAVLVIFVQFAIAVVDVSAIRKPLVADGYLPKVVA